MALSVVLSVAVWCAAWQTASSAGALLPSYQLLLPFPAGPSAAVPAPSSRLVVLLPGTAPTQPQPQPLAATALDAAHQQVEAASARISQLPPQPSRADFQARAQAYTQQQQQQQLQQQLQQLQQQQQQLQDDSVASARTNFQAPMRGRLDFQQQAARQQQQSDYQLLSDGRSEYTSAAGPQPMRPSGFGRSLQTPSYQALVADYRFRQQQQQLLQQQASSYQPLATEYQYRQPQRPNYQGVSTEYRYRQQPAPQQLQPVSSPAARADFRPGPYPLAARANLAQQQQQQQVQQQQQQQVYQLQQQQDYQLQQQQQQEYQQQPAAYDAPRPEFRSLQPQGLLPGQGYSVNFEGDGFGYGYTIRGDHNTQRAY